MGTPFSDNMKPASHHLLPEKQQNQQDERCLTQRDPQRRGQSLLAARQGGNDHQQWNDRQILQQKNAKYLATVRGVRLQAISHQSNHNGGRGHGHDSTENEPDSPAETGDNAG